MGFSLKSRIVLLTSFFTLMGSAQFLTEPTIGDPMDIALTYILDHHQQLGLTESDLAEFDVSDHYTTQHNGVTHIVLRQKRHGLPILMGDLAINITAQGEVINIHNGFVSNLTQRAPQVEPTLTAIQAVDLAAGSLRQTRNATYTLLAEPKGVTRRAVFNAAGVSLDNIPVNLAYEKQGQGNLRLVWEMVIRTGEPGWYHIRVDALDGRILARNDWVKYESYRAFPIPFEHPNDPGASHDLIVDPFHLTASPFGWHDSDGIAGAEDNHTIGNNVVAQEDADGNNGTGFRPDGGASLIFDFAWDSGLSPTGGTNQEAAIVNLFYWNNILHDLHFLYGFDEASGNFQHLNYSGQGLGGDRVQADAQDGSGTNNANFATPPDGQSPRMQMFLFTDPTVDGDLDAGVITHEFGHGISNRLTGGASNSNCLPTNCVFGFCSPIESGGMGEGWSDFWALALTAKGSDTATMPRAMGTYVLGQPLNGPGIRNFRYSTEMAINPQTYGDIADVTNPPHGIGEIWCMALWEVYWAFVDQYGFDADLYSGSGGNNIIMQLVMDGLKLQPCNPTFVDARDAIIMADQVNNGGANECLLWEAFARRGLGVDADDRGDPENVDVVEDFNTPLSCGCDYFTQVAQWPESSILTILGCLPTP